MTHPILPPGSTVSLTLNGIPADLYLRLLLEAGRSGRGLRAEVLRRLQAPGADFDGRVPSPAVEVSRPAAVRS